MKKYVFIFLKNVKSNNIFLADIICDSHARSKPIFQINLLAQS